MQWYLYRKLSTKLLARAATENTKFMITSIGYLLTFSFIQKHNVGWFVLKMIADLLRVCSLHIISRNNSNTFLFINLQKTLHKE